MRSRVAEDPAVIVALEAKAARNPRAYRFWLVFIAIAGDIALTAVLVFPVAAFCAIDGLVPRHRFKWRTPR